MNKTTISTSPTRGRIMRFWSAFFVLCLLSSTLHYSMVAQERQTNPEDYTTYTNGNLAKTSGVTDPAKGTAVMVSGELWDSFMPPNKGPFYSEAAQDMLKTVRVGNYDRAWTTPTHMWLLIRQQSEARPILPMMAVQIIRMQLTQTRLAAKQSQGKAMPTGIMRVRQFGRTRKSGTMLCMRRAGQRQWVSM